MPAGVAGYAIPAVHVSGPVPLHAVDPESVAGLLPHILKIAYTAPLLASQGQGSCETASLVLELRGIVKAVVSFPITLPSSGGLLSFEEVR